MVETYQNPEYDEATEALINAWGGEINATELAEVDKDVRRKIIAVAKLVEVMGEILLNLIDPEDTAWQKGMLEIVNAVSNFIRTNKIPKDLKNRLSAFLINPLITGCYDEKTLSRLPPESKTAAKEAAKEQILFTIAQAKFIINSCQN